MQASRLQLALTGATGVVLLLAACGGDEMTQSDLPEAGTSTSTQPTARPSEPKPTGPATSPEHESTSTSEPQSLPSEHPEAGLTYELPQVSDDEATALQTFLTFESERREATRDSLEVSEELESVTTPELITEIEDSLEYQRENGITYVGQVTGTVTVERNSAFDAQVVACHDYSEIALHVEGEGEQPVEPREDGAESAEFIVELSKPEGMPYQVTSYHEGDPC